jgi:hypothetical protein
MALCNNRAKMQRCMGFGLGAIDRGKWGSINV